MELRVRKKKTSKIKINASQLISNMICMNYDNNKKFGLLQFHSGYGKFYLNSPKGYSRKIINAQTVCMSYVLQFSKQQFHADQMNIIQKASFAHEPIE